MSGFIKDIKNLALKNKYFRQVLGTGVHTQVVIMSIPPGGEIGEEVHKESDQVLYFVKGNGQTILDGQKNNLGEGDLVLVKKGVRHNFINTGRKDLKIITTYSPPHHPEGTIHKTKAEADSAGY